MNIDVKPPVAHQLRTLRKAQGLPLWGLAARARTTATTISAIERWGYVPGPALRARIAAALGIQVTDIWPVGERSIGEQAH